MNTVLPFLAIILCYVLAGTVEYAHEKRMAEISGAEAHAYSHPHATTVASHTYPIAAHLVLDAQVARQQLAHAE